MSAKPNCFLVGAPKCGTTSLAAWLSEHPEVFMSRPKELDFFDTDIGHGYRDGLAQYQRYFSSATTEHRIIAEASTGYLRSKVAADNIIEFVEKPLFIVGLRNPVELAVSWHRHGVAGHWEDEEDFRRAWNLQDARRAGRSIPKHCPDKERLLYGEVCKLGTQLQRLYDRVPRNQIFFYTLEEMQAGPQELWLRVVNFLGLTPHERTEFPALNAAKVLPSWVSSLGRSAYQLKRSLHLANLGFGITSFLVARTARAPENQISQAMCQELTDYFRDDVELLSKVTGRDFSRWTTV